MFAKLLYLMLASFHCNSLITVMIQIYLSA